jgi:hypothetical protein
MPQVRLDPAPPITELMAMALTLEEAAGRWRVSEGEQQRASTVLMCCYADGCAPPLISLRYLMMAGAHKLPVAFTGRNPQAEEHGPAQEVCSLAGQLLQEKGPMLGEYLGIRIDDQVGVGGIWRGESWREHDAQAPRYACMLLQLLPSTW